MFNIVCHIAEVLIQLQQHGHSKYTGWVLTCPCRDTDIVNKLTEVLKDMSNDLEQWQSMVGETRNSFYSLNYYTTQQLLLLRKELYFFIKNPKRYNLSSDVMSLLQCLSREITPQVLATVITAGPHYVDEEEDEQPVIEVADSTSLLSPEVETVSNITQHILASSTSTCPQLEECDLTEKQKGIMDDLVSAYGYSSKLVLLAFERTAKPDVPEDVENWCNEHEEEFTFSEKSIEEIIDIEIEEDDSLTLEKQSVDTTVPDQSPPLTIPSSKVTVKEVVPVTPDHPSVQSLVLAGYSLAVCLQAVECYPDDIPKAMDYINSMEDSEDDDDGTQLETGGLFPIVNGIERQQSHELCIG